jgi:predicted nucleic acid-binding protein
VIRTFLDSGVLLTAWKGKDRMPALSVMEDAGREFVTAEMVKLELLPKPTFEKRRAELEFYREHFEGIFSEPFSRQLGDEALALAKFHGLAAADALNLAAAIRQGAAEFITSELPGKPMFRVKEISVRALSTLPRS